MKYVVLEPHGEKPLLPRQVAAIVKTEGEAMICEPRNGRIIQRHDSQSLDPVEVAYASDGTWWKWEDNDV